MEGREVVCRIPTVESVAVSVSVSIGGDSRSSVPEDEADVSKAREMDREKDSSRVIELA
jgi:hypothetical protein